MRFSLLFFTLFTVHLSAQSNLHGYLYDAESGEVLIGATLQLLPGGGGTTTNAYGFFSLARTPDAKEVLISYLGFQPQTLVLAELKDEALRVELQPAGTALTEVVVSAKNTRPSRRQFSATSLGVTDIKKLPAFAGEADLVKALQLTAGVKNNSEGSSGMFVRGGGSDQNLILLDEAPIYNPSHLFGLISVFNPDALKDVKLYKGTFPANYGGRASAVLDVRTRDGNTKGFRMTGGLSPLSGRLSVEGPLAGERASFLLSVRRSLFDLAVEPGTDLALEPRFADLNLKAQLKTNATDKLLLSAYLGSDRLRSDADLDNQWGNQTLSLRYVKQLSPKLFSTLSLIHGAYRNDLAFKSAGLDYEWRNQLQTETAKVDFSFYPAERHKFYAGASAQYHRFTPGESAEVGQSIPRSQAVETGLYVQHDWRITPRLNLNYGLRLSGQNNVGQTRLFDYAAGAEVPAETATSGGYHSEFTLEPRVQLSYNLSEASTLRLAYARAAQYQHLLRNATLSYSSLETWFPVNPNIAPLRTRTASAGWFYESGAAWAGSVEVFGRRTEGQLDYLAQASFINNPYVEREVRAGEAEAYGTELSLRRKGKRFSGGLNYSFSRALLTIPGINGGEAYPAVWDIPHDLKLNLRSEITQRLSVSLTGNLSSGRPITLPIGFYENAGRRVPIYSTRNGRRVATYHRADVAFTLAPKTRARRFASTWSAGVYNVYGRKNALGYEFDDRGSDVTVFRYSLFGALPFVSWSFTFQ